MHSWSESGESWRPTRSDQAGAITGSFGRPKRCSRWRLSRLWPSAAIDTATGFGHLHLRTISVQPSKKCLVLGVKDFRTRLRRANGVDDQLSETKIGRLQPRCTQRGQHIVNPSKVSPGFSQARPSLSQRLFCMATASAGSQAEDGRQSPVQGSFLHCCRASAQPSALSDKDRMRCKPARFRTRRAILVPRTSTPPHTASISR